MVIAALLGLQALASYPAFATTYTYRVPVTGLTVQAAAVAPATLTIDSATYGANCGTPTNNMLTQAQSTCDGLTSCSFTPLGLISDPAVNCAKTATVTYHCGTGSEKSISVPAEAGYTTIAPSCP